MDKPESIELFVNLLEDFLLKDPTMIRSSNRLAEYMAMHARTIRSIVTGILKDDGNGRRICQCFLNYMDYIAELNLICARQ